MEELLMQQITDQFLHILLGLTTGAFVAWFAPRQNAPWLAMLAIIPFVFAIEVVHQWPPFPVGEETLLTQYADAWLDTPFYFLGAYISGILVHQPLVRSIGKKLFASRSGS